VPSDLCDKIKKNMCNISNASDAMMLKINEENNNKVLLWKNRFKSCKIDCKTLNEKCNDLKRKLNGSHIPIQMNKSKSKQIYNKNKGNAKSVDEVGEVNVKSNSFKKGNKSHDNKLYNSNLAGNININDNKIVSGDNSVYLNRNDKSRNDVINTRSAIVNPMSVGCNVNTMMNTFLECLDASLSTVMTEMRSALGVCSMLQADGGAPSLTDPRGP